MAGCRAKLDSSSLLASVIAAGVVATGVVAAPVPVRPAASWNLASTTDDNLLGDAAAQIMGGGGLQTPPERYMETVEALYLQPHGFTGALEPVTTPEWLTNYDVSETLGAQAVVDAIENEIAAGGVDADNPVPVFGYSQASSLSTYAMEMLDDDEVASGDVYFALVGNTSNPNGGLLSAFDLPPGSHPHIPFIDVTLDQTTPDDLYPGDVYTLEYDGASDFPHYPINLVSDLNAVIGFVMEHFAYLGLSSERIDDAITLDTAGDSLVDYHMIPEETLPLLAPLQLLPVVGEPLYDLMEPDLRIIANLGYGQIDHGWYDGPANVETPIELFPTDVDWSEVASALDDGATKGFEDFVSDLQDPQTYEVTPLVDHPVLSTLEEAAYNAGLADTPDPSSMLEFLGPVAAELLGPPDLF